ncbi:SagB/ThcOx family dehydrogenase [Nocardioides sp.]|uniref:SagB/ThcOx family dehydrogenase n=1 Tax=Nocardioides sp. TaxID=35761 RepID=UPI0025DCA0BC|nr:SagB/ThcOx family dehydrogenase [Nocardioides sp.]
MADRLDVRSPRLRLTRRHVSALLLGGLAAAGCATMPSKRHLSQRPPDRVVSLPQPQPLGVLSLTEALARRQSVREFELTTPTTPQIGQLLWAAQGITRSSGGRTAPSAGALYPLEVYAVTRGTLWHYLPDGHRAEQWDAPATLAAELGDAAVGQDAVSSAPLLVVITGVVDRTYAKYRGRAAQFVTLEAGHCAQNVLLAAVALGLGAVPVGALSDEAVRRRLGLTDALTPYYLVPVGTPRAAGE